VEEGPFAVSFLQHSTFWLYFEWLRWWAIFFFSCGCACGRVLFSILPITIPCLSTLQELSASCHGGSCGAFFDHRHSTRPTTILYSAFAAALALLGRFALQGATTLGGSNFSFCACRGSVFAVFRSWWLYGDRRMRFAVHRRRDRQRAVAGRYAQTLTLPNVTSRFAPFCGTFPATLRPTYRLRPAFRLTTTAWYAPACAHAPPAPPRCRTAPALPRLFFFLFITFILPRLPPHPALPAPVRGLAPLGKGTLATGGASGGTVNGIRAALRRCRVAARWRRAALLSPGDGITL